MAYFAELDDHPKEVRQGFAGNIIRWWPKVPGEGNVLADVAPAPTFTLYAPDGTALRSNAAVTVETVEGVSLFKLAVDATDRARWELLEHYRADITWSYDEEERLETVRFAVVREPYVPAVSLNDFLEHVADAEQYLTGQAQAIGDGRTAEQHASVLGVRAWGDVYRRLQARLRDQGRILPRLLLDRWKLQEVVVAAALLRLFRAEGGTERARQLAEDWKTELEGRIAGLGDMPYDTDDDGVADEELHAPIEVQLRRSW